MDSTPSRLAPSWLKKLPPLMILMAVMGLPLQPARGQLLVDTLFVWQGYNRQSTCGLHVYRNTAEARKAFTIVLTEIGDNRGPSTLEDASYLAELIGRSYGVDPTQAYWIFYWGAFSFTGAEDSGKEFYLRATFSRTRSGRLGSAHWRVVKKQDVELYTDRQFR